MIEITAENFTAEVYNKVGPTVVDFWAEWCPPCKALTPVLEKLSAEIPEARFAKLDTDAHVELTKTFKINSLPTVVIFYNGAEVERIVGFRKAEHYAEVLKKYTTGAMQKIVFERDKNDKAFIAKDGNIIGRQG